MAPFYQITFSGLAKVAFLLVNILLYKALPAEQVGVFALLYAVAFILATISECGLRGLLVRELARQTDALPQAQPLLTGALHSRLLTLLPYLLIGYVCSRLFVHNTPPDVIMGLLLAASLDSNANVLRGVLRAWNRTTLDPLLTCAFRLLLLAGTATLFAIDSLTLPHFVLLFLVTATLDLTATLCLIPRLTRLSLNPVASVRSTFTLIRRGSHFILLAILGTIYLRTGSLVLGFSGTPEALHAVAGLNLSARIPEGVAFLPLALMNAAIPYFSRYARQPKTIVPHFRKLELVLGSAGIIIGVGLVAHATPIILLLATPDYLPYKTIFQFYGLTVFFTFLQYTYLNLLICLNKEKQATARYAIILAINLLLNILFVPRFGIMATILALLVCEVASAAIDLILLRPHGIHPSRAVLLTWLAILALCSLLAFATSALPPILAMAIYWLLGGAMGAWLLQQHNLTEIRNLPPAQ